MSSTTSLPTHTLLYIMQLLAVEIHLVIQHVQILEVCLLEMIEQYLDSGYTWA